MDFKFTKPFYSERELLKVVPVKRSTFYSWQSHWISLGNDPREMGKILIQNSPTSKRPIVFWNAPLFLKWMSKHKIQQPTKYDYEVADKEYAIAVVKGVKTNVS